MEYVLTFIAGMIVAMLLLRWAIHRAIDRVLDKIATQEQSTQDTAQRMELRVELDNNVYFCYNNTDGTFVCQGSNLQEIQTNFQARFPGVGAVIVDGDDSSISWLKTEMSKDENSNSIRHSP